MSIRVLDPTFEGHVAAKATVTGLPSLAGRTVGLLDNSKIKVKEILDEIDTLLRTQHGVSNVIRLRKPDASRPAPAEVLARLAGCDAFISAVGD